MEFLFQYGLFLAQALTIVLAVGAVLVLAVGLGRRGAKHEGIEVTRLNDRYEQMTETLQRAMLPKKAYKERAKRKKAADKADAKKKAAQAKQVARPSDVPPDRPGETSSAPARGDATGAGERARLFVLDFHGDLRASGTTALREEVTAVLSVATDQDEVLVRIENGGGMVHGHGLAASQLARLRDRAIPLTIAIDKVAASGGYMMACVANRILAAPFAIVGSIGVLAQIPNFHRLLDRAGIDFELIKAGDHKRTLTLFGKNTNEDREKMQHDIEQVHELFKHFVARYRPTLDIEAVATGEHWFGTEARERQLVDEVLTSDDYLLKAATSRDIYAVSYHEKTGLSERLGSLIGIQVDRVVDRLAAWEPMR